MQALNALHLLAHIVEGEIFLVGELENAAKLDAEADRLRGIVIALGVDQAKVQVHAKRQAIRDCPTEENFFKPQAGELDKEMVKEHNRQLRRLAFYAFKAFRDQQYAPFYQVIISRLAAAARERILTIEEREADLFEALGIKPRGESQLTAVIREAIEQACCFVRVTEGVGVVLFVGSTGFATLREALLDAQRAYQASQDRSAAGE